MQHRSFGFLSTWRDRHCYPDCDEPEHAAICKELPEDNEQVVETLIAHLNSHGESVAEKTRQYAKQGTNHDKADMFRRPRRCRPIQALQAEQRHPSVIKSKPGYEKADHSNKSAKSGA